MTIQYSTTLRNAQLDQIETVTGVTPELRLYSGAIPANAAAAPTGTLLVQMSLPSDWMAAASGGIKAKSGSWSGSGLAGAGTGTAVGYFRIYDSTGTTCHIQGTVTVTGAGGDMTMDNTNVAQNQVVTVNTFSVTAGNP
ncbi:MAG TPA: hypothetical protein VFV57_05970 [Limnobacter sp.]|nr:hypothetical protein [Limnobacter sp.]